MALRPRPAILLGLPRLLGDLVMTLPALAYLREAFPDSRCLVAVPKGMRRFIGRQIPGAEFVDMHPMTLLPMLARLPWDRYRLRRMGPLPDIGVNLDSSKTKMLWMRGLGLRRLVARRRRSYMIAPESLIEPVPGHTHKIQYQLDLVRGVRDMFFPGAGEVFWNDAIPHPHIQVGAEWLREAEAARETAGMGGVYAVLSPRSSNPVKDWPLENYRELMRRMERELSIPTLVCGTAAQREDCAALAADCPGAVSVAGKTSICSFIGLTAMGRVCIGGDSGSTHVGAALGIPTLSMFRASHFERYRPVGPRTEAFFPVAHARPEQSGLGEVDVVYEKVKALLVAGGS